MNARKDPIVKVEELYPALHLEADFQQRRTVAQVGQGLVDFGDHMKMQKFSPTGSSAFTKSSSNQNGTESFGSCSRQMSGLEVTSGMQTFSNALDKFSNLN